MNVSLVLTPMYLAPWQPVLVPTTAKLRLARWFLIVALLGLIIHFVIVWSLSYNPDAAIRIRSLTALLASFSVLTSIFIATVWALSYERVMPKALNDARHPLRPLLVAVIRWRARRRLKGERGRRVDGR
jgi:hypothetical protein